MPPREEGEEGANGKFKFPHPNVRIYFIRTMKNGYKTHNFINQTMQQATGNSIYLHYCNVEIAKLRSKFKYCRIWKEKEFTHSEMEKPKEKQI